ncbi:PhzF family phenazine biosynthesis isomerase [bacterium]|nr:PhzF family phenazine biosynthesis isomerase [bacterium]
MQANNKEQFPFYRVDAFTDRLFSGNPAGVCICNHSIDAAIMQAIATETNLSDTAFISFNGWEALQKGDVLNLRWFTPKTEVMLCGHATLAAAHVLFFELELEREELIFDTLSGQLKARREGDDIVLCFPTYTGDTITVPDMIISSLGLGTYQQGLYVPALKYLLIKVESESTVIELVPDLDSLGKMNLGETGDLLGLIVTASCKTGNYDFISRFFAPWLGVDEDPVTGSAHTVLAPFWAALLEKKELYAFQASKRGGSIRMRLLSDREVEIFGQAIIFCRGTTYTGVTLS